MFDSILKFSIEQRGLIMLATLGLCLLGVYNFQRLPIDAVPDITNVQVQINTEAPGYSPLEVESLITFPIEVATLGPPQAQGEPLPLALWALPGHRYLRGRHRHLLCP